jgi:ADP-ribosylglycohydrolase
MSALGLPYALFMINYYSVLLMYQLNWQQNVDEATRITHSDINAINGAILQCAAVHLALKSGRANGDFNPISFVNKLMTFMAENVDEK